MRQGEQANLDRVLYRQLVWLIRLRWAAGLVALLAGAVDRLWLHWFDGAGVTMAVGAAILGYNALLVGHLRRRSMREVSPDLLAWGQIVPDLLCLTIIVCWTGGTQSPLLGAFVFHMVFASLLLTRTMAYGAALLAIVMLTVGLGAHDLWPTGLGERLRLSGWGVVLIFTVYLSNHTSRALRDHQRKLIEQNRRIRRITRQLRHHQRALIQHEKMAAMGQMAAGVAHEISNPLANMDSILQLVQRRPQQMDPAKVEQLREQAERIRRIIQSMTDFAHPTDTDWRATPINDLVGGALALLNFDRRQRAVVIDHKPSAGGCSVYVQSHAMQQVLVNLLMNAMDATAEQPDARISVGCRCDDDHCMIDVRDNGPGIPPDALDHVFEPFFTTKPLGRGTGLGLSISYSLVENQGGTLEIASKVGEGTTVTVKLPRTEAEQHCAPGCCVASASGAAVEAS